MFWPRKEDAGGTFSHFSAAPRMAAMSKAGSILFGILIGAAARFFTGVATSQLTQWDNNPLIRRVGGWGQVCGLPAGAYVGGVVGYLVALRKRD